MKVYSTLAVAGIAVALSCQAAFAQETPSVTKEYNNDQIAKMILASKSVHSRDVKPTELLANKLAKDFPQAHDVEWEVGSDVYEAEFEIGRTDYTAYYDAKGNLLMYKLELRESEVPANIKKAATDQYPGYVIDDAKKIVRGTETFYKLDLEKGELDVKVTYKSDGTVVNNVID